MKVQGTLVLNRSEVSTLLDFSEHIAIVETAFRLHATGKSLKPEMMHVDSVGGEFHIKAGGLRLDKMFFAVKVNGGFFQNGERFGMPAIQGAILLCDGENGYPLAIMDSGEITVKRTGAAVAVAAKYLARPDSTVATIVGCGMQGRIQLQAVKAVCPLRRAYVFDIDKSKAVIFASKMSEDLGFDVVASNDLKSCALESDIVATCTPSRKYFLTASDLSAGTFVAAMGADSPEKQELHPELLKTNKLVVDLVEQCARAGELHHAIKDGMGEQDVYAELGDIVAGKKPGRTSKDEIIIFDATGTALQDTAVAAAAYRKAIPLGIGRTFDFFH